MEDEAAKRLSEQLKTAQKEDASSKAVNLIKFRKNEKVEINADENEDDPLIDEPVVLVDVKPISSRKGFPFKNKWVNSFVWVLFLSIDILIGFIVYIYVL